MRVLELPVSFQTAKIAGSGNSIKSRLYELSSLHYEVFGLSTVHNTTYRNVEYYAMYLCLKMMQEL